MRTCTWREDEDGNWCTECGNIFVLDGAPPEEHGMLFCCYCGGALKQKLNYEQREQIADAVKEFFDEMTGK